jgi:tetratricopeptide (TPR) repeat protein
MSQFQYGDSPPGGLNIIVLIRDFELRMCRSTISQWQDVRNSSDQLELFHFLDAERLNILERWNWLIPSWKSNPDEAKARLLGEFGQMLESEANSRFPNLKQTQLLSEAAAACCFLRDESSLPAILDHWGAVLSDQGLMIEARNKHQEAMTLAERLGDERGVSRAKNCLGCLHLLIGEPATALEYLSAAYPIEIQSGSTNRLCMLLGNLGAAAAQLGETEAASQAFTESLRLARDKRNRIAEAKAIGNLGLIDMYRGLPESAENKLQEWAEISESLHDPASLGTARLNLGILYLGKGELSRSKRELTRAQHIFETIGDHVDLGKVIGNLGLIYHMQGDEESALACFERQYAIGETCGDSWSMTSSLGNRGLIHLDRREYVQAEACFRHQLDLAHRTGDRRATIVPNAKLGQVLADTGQAEEGKRHSRMALALAEEFEDRLAEATALHHLSVILLEHGDSNEGLSLLHQQAELARQTGQRDQEGMALFNIAVHTARSGYLAKAIEIGEQALLILTETRPAVAMQFRKQINSWAEQAQHKESIDDLAATDHPTGSR